MRVRAIDAKVGNFELEDRQALRLIVIGDVSSPTREPNWQGVC
jgi:hypothetical protein